jgi:hypothetical protein
MSQIAPPRIPRLVALEDGDGRNKVRLRLYLLWLTVLTVLLTTWLITLGPIPGIIAIVVAKHVLVAILVMAIGVDARSESLLE